MSRLSTPLPTVPLVHTTARYLLAGRNAARRLGQAVVASALQAARSSARSEFQFTTWTHGQTSTFAGTPERPGIGRCWPATVPQYGSMLSAYAEQVHAKGTGWCIALGTSRYGGSSDAECVTREGAFLDSDNLGSIAPLIDALSAADLAFVAQHRPGTGRSHVEIAYASPMHPPGDERAIPAWKASVYRPRLGWLLGVLSEVAGLDCVLPTDGSVPSSSKLGFDAMTDRLLQLGNPYCRRSEAEIRPETEWRDGGYFDLDVFLDATEFAIEPGDSVAATFRRVSSSLPASAKTDAGSDELYIAPPAPDFSAEGEAWVEAFSLAGLLVARRAGMAVVECPFAASHSGGMRGDTSTVLFANGWFKCLHGSCANRRQEDVFEALPAGSRAALLAALPAIGRQAEDALFASYYLRAAAELSVSNIDAFSRILQQIRAADGPADRWNWMVRKARRS